MCSRSTRDRVTLTAAAAKGYHPTNDATSGGACETTLGDDPCLPCSRSRTIGANVNTVTAPEPWGRTSDRRFTSRVNCDGNRSTKYTVGPRTHGVSHVTNTGPRSAGQRPHTNCMQTTPLTYPGFQALGCQSHGSRTLDLHAGSTQ